ncbi:MULTISPECIES: recombinase family protein [Halocynthiibacter]|uniref:Recombinase family protein n=1 Tax=Halocynthiibacter halioticoli TaxID=2986804 RepID=A0AAE3LR37_9RHOB|nr:MULTISPECIES: recombinase family protein [Halocynthiibacter]MCV6825147.1 recombinase family protein [Halocynthiibacter halioticoli]MCW4058148.1 recombinase family protein [Halocynthiibacter sp. SDUM655004]
MFEEKVSAKNTDRLQLSILRDIIQPGDEIVVHSLDRLARSLKDLETIVKEVVDKGAVISFLKENLTFGPTTNLLSVMMLQVLGAIGQFERALILDRQREGIAKAKEAGKYKGRPTTINRRVAEKMFSSGSTPAEVADVMKIGIASAYRLRKEIGAQNC